MCIFIKEKNIYMKRDRKHRTRKSDRYVIVLK